LATNKEGEVFDRGSAYEYPVTLRLVT